MVTLEQLHRWKSIIADELDVLSNEFNERSVKIELLPRGDAESGIARAALRREQELLNGRLTQLMRMRDEMSAAQ